jgi:hypothetical protein
MACLSLHNVGMPALSYVYPYPAHGRGDSPTDEDEMADVAIRGCRSVTELYSEALASLGLVNGVSELRLFIRHDRAWRMCVAACRWTRSGVGSRWGTCLFRPTSPCVRRS